MEQTVNGTRLSIDTCHRLMEERTVQESMDAFRDEVEKSNRGADPKYIEEEWQQYCRQQISGNNRHVQLLTNGKLYRVDDIDFALNINSPIPDQRDGPTIKAHWFVW